MIQLTLENLLDQYKITPIYYCSAAVEIGKMAEKGYFTFHSIFFGVLNTTIVFERHQRGAWLKSLHVVKSMCHECNRKVTVLISVIKSYLQWTSSSPTRPSQRNHMDLCNQCVGSETLGRISIALNFFHQLNPNLVISQ